MMSVFVAGMYAGKLFVGNETAIVGNANTVLKGKLEVFSPLLT